MKYCDFRAGPQPQWLMLALVPLLSSCATNGRVIEGNACAWARPILVSRQDVLTDPTARQILVHNETGRRLCGWGSKHAANQ